MLRHVNEDIYSSLLYCIPKDQHDEESIRNALLSHPEVEFISLAGVDLGGQETDEKIPIELFLEDISEFLNAGIQTDGSSVYLPEIASLNDAKVMILPDKNINWYVDYNFDNINTANYKPVGTLRIPSFLKHGKEKVGSRDILRKAIDNFKDEVVEIIKENPLFLEEVGIASFDDIDDIIITSATEMEFWVNTPADIVDEEQLSISQSLKEQYWKRTRGEVRTALERTIWFMGKYGFEPEMGHKEVGGVRRRIGLGKEGHFMEQLEIDWKYSEAMQAADNDIFVRDLIEDIFNFCGLEVTFDAKPNEGVAGSGKHTHLGIAAKLKTGKFVNLFSPKDMKSEYMTSLGYGALMGILKNYEVINPFVSSTNDALNRLKPGFEAPVCIVTSLGRSKEEPSRNRSILIGLIKDFDNPMATRFELRAPNPHSNTYLVISACLQGMIDGIRAVSDKKATLAELEAELSKSYGDEGFYLEKNRQYRSEEDVYELSQEERNRLFGVPPRTVWENIVSCKSGGEKRKALYHNGVFSEKTVISFRYTAIQRWANELLGRIIPNNMDIVRECKKVHTEGDISDLDVVMWNKINTMRWYLMKGSMDTDSLFTRIRKELEEKNYDQASELQIEMSEKILELKELYYAYKKNQF